MGGVHKYGFYPCKDISLGNEIRFLGPSIGEHSGFKKINVRKVETLRTGGDKHACMPSDLHCQRMCLYQTYSPIGMRSRKSKDKRAVHIGHNIVVWQRFCKGWKGES